MMTMEIKDISTPKQNTKRNQEHKLCAIQTPTHNDLLAETGSDIAHHRRHTLRERVTGKFFK